MNALTRLNPFRKQWDPLQELDEMQDQLASLWRPWPLRTENGKEETMTLSTWAPVVDITEDDKEFLIKAELPEMKKEDIKVIAEDGVLQISGERKFEKEEKKKKYHRIERSYGSFLRTFTIPEGANSAKVNAEFKDGVLTVHLPKDEKAKAKVTEIKVS